jgi:uncharacterized RDD family membrane protein YckC
MFCSSCGAQTADGSAFCGKCGRPIVGYSVGQSAAPAAAAAGAYAGGGAIDAPGVPQAASRAYAGFWLRFVAHIIDELLIAAAFGILALIVLGAIGFENIRDQIEEMGRAANGPNPAFPAFFFVMIFTFVVCGTIAGWLYFAGMESSEYQGTLGKMAIGLVVTDLNGDRVSFARASGRFFAKIITGLVPLAIGWIMAGFTEKKQALHDMIASCLVLRKV